jgi:hypothetical protein
MRKLKIFNDINVTMYRNLYYLVSPNELKDGWRTFRFLCRMKKIDTRKYRSHKSL